MGKSLSDDDTLLDPPSCEVDESHHTSFQRTLHISTLETATNNIDRQINCSNNGNDHIGEGGTSNEKGRSHGKVNSNSDENGGRSAESNG